MTVSCSTANFTNINESPWSAFVQSHHFVRIIFSVKQFMGKSNINLRFSFFFASSILVGYSKLVQISQVNTVNLFSYSLLKICSFKTLLFLDFLFFDSRKPKKIYKLKFQQLEMVSQCLFQYQKWLKRITHIQFVCFFEKTK